MTIVKYRLHCNEFVVYCAIYGVVNLTIDRTLTKCIDIYLL